MIMKDRLYPLSFKIQIEHKFNYHKKLLFSVYLEEYLNPEVAIIYIPTFSGPAFSCA